MNQHRFRENISRKALREFFNQRENTPARRYSDEEYNTLYRQYLDLADEHKERQRRKRNEEAKNKRQTQLFLSQIGNVSKEQPNQPKSLFPRKKLTISQVDKVVDAWYKKTKKQNTHFEITLASGVKPDVKNTFKFNHIHHFQNWFEKVKTQTYEIRSESWGNITVSTDDEFRNLFADVFVKNIKFISGGCNKHKAGNKKFKSPFYEFKLYNPVSMNNNCFFKCLEYLLGKSVPITDLRKLFTIQTGQEVCIDDAYKLLQHYAMDVLIIDEFYNEEMDDERKYILLLGNHYYIVESWEEIIRKGNKTKRGLMTFDFETRKTEDYHLIKASNTKSFILKDALCCVYYRPYKATEMIEKIIISNEEKTSARQFLDFLNQEAKKNKSYNVIAHNGGRFDFYFLMSVMTEQEIKDSQIQMRGLTIISLNYRGNLFKDSCCFLTDSLENLSQSFKVSHGKMVEFELHGEKLSSSQLCFYQPYLSFSQFLQLQHDDTEYWKLYEKYCMYDCIALFEIWEKFTECINSLVEKISPFLLKKCPLMSSMTIGSHSKKILVEINKFNDKINWNRRNIQKFVGLTFEKQENGKVSEKWDREKYEFLCKFKRGGISHCHQAGKHHSGITGVDIASQYPASLIYAFIPTGESRKVKSYDKKLYGFYQLKNLVFDSEYSLKPVAGINSNKTLKWATNTMDELFVDSYMLEYIIENFGLKHFDVVEGLVSNQHISAHEIFGKYILPFYKEKQNQDFLKEKKDPSYNPALRTTIKLYLNSLTGKLVENPSEHFSLTPNEDAKLNLNGVGMTRDFHTEKINDWITCGIMVYSYSKRLLFEYINCLPDKSNDVIHIETDGIYFSTRHLETFSKNLNNYSGDYPCKFGEELGNLKIEKTTYEGQVAYFLGKKFYCITLPFKNAEYIDTIENKDGTEERYFVKDGRKTLHSILKKPQIGEFLKGEVLGPKKLIYHHDDVSRIKGICQATINDFGKKIQLVDLELYEDIYNGFSITKEFWTLRKALFTQNTHISSHIIKRTIKPNCTYREFH